MTHLTPRRGRGTSETRLVCARSIVLTRTALPGRTIFGSRSKGVLRSRGVGGRWVRRRLHRNGLRGQGCPAEERLWAIQALSDIWNDYEEGRLQKVVATVDASGFESNFSRAAAGVMPPTK